MKNDVTIYCYEGLINLAPNRFPLFGKQSGTLFELRPIIRTKG